MSLEGFLFFLVCYSLFLLKKVKTRNGSTSNNMFYLKSSHCRVVTFRKKFHTMFKNFKNYRSQTILFNSYTSRIYKRKACIHQFIMYATLMIPCIFNLTHLHCLSPYSTLLQPLTLWFVWTVVLACQLLSLLWWTCLSADELSLCFNMILHVMPTSLTPLYLCRPSGNHLTWLFGW